MTEPRLHHVQCLDTRGLHRMAYWEWGDAANPRVVVCVHGLTRQGRDFDTLAQDLARDCRVICPDVVGRGRSDWLADPAGYTIPAYVADMVTLVARLGVEQVDWVGTSMGGLIGLGLASLPNTPVRRLVLNDIGPAIEAAALARIGSYVGQPAHWQTVEEAADVVHVRAHRRAFELASLSGWARVHAATIDLDDARVLVVGPSGAGKTTLAARLLLDGADVQGDESVLVRRGESLAVPRALHLKPGSDHILPELAELLPTMPVLNGVTVLDPARIGRPIVLRLAPVTHVVMLA